MNVVVASNVEVLKMIEIESGEILKMGELVTLQVMVSEWDSFRVTENVRGVDLTEVV